MDRLLTEQMPDGGWNCELRLARPAPDERMAEALDVVESKRDADGRWPLEVAYHEALPIDLGEALGDPSRWLMLRALRVLRWAGREIGL